MVKPDSLELGKDLAGGKKVLTMTGVIDYALQTRSATHMFMRQLAGVTEELPMTLDALRAATTKPVEAVRRLVGPYLATQVLEGLSAPNSVR